MSPKFHSIGRVSCRLLLHGVGIVVGVSSLNIYATGRLASHCSAAETAVKLRECYVIYEFGLCDNFGRGGGGQGPDCLISTLTGSNNGP